MDRITTILKRYISDRIPTKATNVFWQMFNGIESMFSLLEYRLDILKRERNILTAQHLSSLRHIASTNGFEPVLKIPASGLLNIKVNPKLFNRKGFPLFLPPYAVFTDKVSKLNYYYNSDKIFRIDGNNLILPVVEGTIQQVKFTSDGNYIERYYLLEENIAEGSITIEVNGVRYQQVKTFYNNVNVNDNKQFVLKYSSDMQKPFILYVKGTKQNDTVTVIYRLTSGELGNIEYDAFFETENIIDNYGANIEVDEEEMLISVLSGFEFGSNGTDENSLRSSIGFNHGVDLLFDDISYRNFLNKFSTLLIQKIDNPKDGKTIHNISLSKKQSVNLDADIINQYKAIIKAKSYLLLKQDKLNLSKILEEYEFALSSHNILDSQICNFALQISFENQIQQDYYTDDIKKLIYSEFAKFLYDKNHIFNIENKFEEFMVKNKIKFEYLIFNQRVEERKIKEKITEDASYIIKNDEYLPILNGNFIISDSNFDSLKLFFDVNIVTQNF